MKAYVILEGTGGELDRQEVAVEAAGLDTAAVARVIASWQLDVGDTIRIVDADASAEDSVRREARDARDYSGWPYSLRE